MRILDLYKIEKLYFSPRDLADAFKISYGSAKVACTRYAKAGLLIRIKRNYYITQDKWLNLSKEEQFAIANTLQVPSYISLTTALSHYDISTQIQRDFIESVCVKRSKSITIKQKQFNFIKIQQRYYNNFYKKDTFFIATPEKAFLDSLYLMAYYKYKLDISAVDMAKLDKAKIKALIKKYPLRVKELWRKMCKS